MIEPFRLAVVLACAFGAILASFGHEPSPLPAGRAFKLIWHDEFDGDALDTSKWNFRTNFWGRRAKWFATPEDHAVVVSNGLARFRIVKRSDGSFCSAQLQTGGGLIWDHQPVVPKGDQGVWWIPKRSPAKFEHRYGYYECRCRTQQRGAWWSAFWMQSEANGTTLDPGRSGIEQDIMESFAPGKLMPLCFHYNGYGADYKCFYIPRCENPEKGLTEFDQTKFHTFGLLWEPDGYTAFLDGVQRGEKVGKLGVEAVSHVPQFLLLSTEVMGYRRAHGTAGPVDDVPSTCASGDEFLVDWVRVYDLLH